MTNDRSALSAIFLFVLVFMLLSWCTNVLMSLLVATALVMTKPAIGSFDKYYATSLKQSVNSKFPFKALTSLGTKCIARLTDKKTIDIVFGTIVVVDHEIFTSTYIGLFNNWFQLSNDIAL